MIDEGIYLFFANELSTPQDVLNPFFVVNFSKEFLEDIRTHFMRFDLDASDDDEPHAELKAVTKQKFNEYCGRTRTVLFVCTKSLIEFEFALRESAKAVDVFRDTISNNGFMFGAEIWDACFFWTGASIRRWFKSRFPLKPKVKPYAKPPSVLDLLYEFLESVSHSQDNLIILKETLPALEDKDQLFVKDILNGKNPKNSKQAQDASARILRALRDRTV